MTEERRQQIEADCDAAITNDKMLPYKVDFYCPGCPGFTFSPYKGRMRKGDNNRESRVDQVIASFTECAVVRYSDGRRPLKIGHYSTNHPYAVKAMVERMFTLKDIVGPEEFDALVVPDNQKLLIEQTRHLATQNALQKHLAQEEERQRELAEARAETMRLRRALADKEKDPEKEPEPAEEDPQPAPVKATALPRVTGGIAQLRRPAGA